MRTAKTREERVRAIRAVLPVAVAPAALIGAEAAGGTG
jgi:hypothetical protein